VNFANLNFYFLKIVDNFTIQREAWAKAFLQTQICHSAAILFKAIFTPDEIQNCTLAGRNGTNRLDLKKRAAIFRKPLISRKYFSL